MPVLVGFQVGLDPYWEPNRLQTATHAELLWGKILLSICDCGQLILAGETPICVSSGLKNASRLFCWAHCRACKGPWACDVLCAFSDSSFLDAFLEGLETHMDFQWLTPIASPNVEDRSYR